MQSSALALRTRIITTFGFGSLLLSILLSGATYSLTRTSDIKVHLQQARTSTINNAIALNEHLGPQSLAASYIYRIQALATPEGTIPGVIDDNAMYFVARTDGYFETEIQLTKNELPREFVESLTPDGVTTMLFKIDEIPFYAVGVPLPNPPSNAYYVQASPLDDVEETLSTLLVTLIAATAVTTILGVAFAVYMVTRLFRPLGSVSEAAELIAQGDLSTRLGSMGDPDLDKLVTSFNDMSSALEKRIVRDARFTSDVSHELRSPLMTLTGSVSLLERHNDELPERAQTALGLLSAEVSKFKTLVDDLLQISRFDVGAVSLRTEEVMFEEFVAKALESVAGSDSGIEIISEPGLEDTIIEIDKRRIAQVIRNLCENADKYAGGVTQVRLTSNGSDITIELEDEGPGVPATERELIFERFARGSEGGRRGDATGGGLGLALVREHLNLHGGTIAATDRVDAKNGARFVISLPGVVRQ